MESIVVHTTCKKPDIFLVLGVIGALVLHCHRVLLLLKTYFSTVFTPAAIISGVARVGRRGCSGYLSTDE